MHNYVFTACFRWEEEEFMRVILFHVETDKEGRHPCELEGCDVGCFHPGKCQFYIHTGSLSDLGFSAGMR